MSDLVAKRFYRPKRDNLSEQELKARQKIIDEAAAAGATLERPGAKGGLTPSLVLGVFRRDGWACKGCGTKEEIGPHHKGGIVRSTWLSKKGHRNDLNNLSILCKDCHGKAHNEARADGVDSSQILPEGDRGNPRRDPSAR